ncbi:MAG: UDP-3-O-acyl-N-acetylglucosamine deacetylase, partial [Planctomycetota bacterium]|nr:UDP-3-O-acyl-N-acetylglucosamine deacetylase [Planctomycetota bacterium]
MSHSQCTIRDTVEMKGKGLHEGVEVTLRLLPAGANEGLSFVRVDLEGKPRIP